MDMDPDQIDEAVLALLISDVTTERAPGNPSTGPRWSDYMQRDLSRTQSAKPNLSYSLTKACVSPKHYSESYSQSDAKHEARHS